MFSIISEYELLERRCRESFIGTAGAKALPADGDWGVDVQEDEKWAERQSLRDRLRVDESGDIVGAPVSGRVLEEILNRRELDSNVRKTGGSLGERSIGRTKRQHFKAMVSHQVVQDSVLSGADAYVD